MSRSVIEGGIFGGVFQKTMDCGECLVDGLVRLPGWKLS
jgi:hypothetical protein